jgi:hypothetical protein
MKYEIRYRYHSDGWTGQDLGNLTIERSAETHVNLDQDPTEDDLRRIADDIERRHSGHRVVELSATRDGPMADPFIVLTLSTKRPDVYL